MSHPAREPFSSRQFNKLDPQARLDEFQKRLDRLKSEFNIPQRQNMFESTGRPFFANQPNWTGPSNNMNAANGQVPQEKSIPIHVQHERSRSEPMDNANPNANQAGGSPNTNDSRTHFMPDGSFFQHQFQSPFANGEGAEPGAEPRVHHIPIQVESRNSAARPQTTNPVHANQQPNSGAAPSQSPAPSRPTVNHPIRPTATTTFSESKPDRSIPIPVQIAKSSSTPETSKKCENTFQQASAATANASSQAQSANINQPSSDPAIADPKKVYAMGYEPLTSNQTEQPKVGESKKETPFDYVKEILDDLKNYESQVHEFNGTTPEDKGYRFLDEMLTLCILRLDCINIDGNDELRKYRKAAINEVNRVAAILEAKVSKKSNAQNSNEDIQSSKVQDTSMETDAAQEEPKEKNDTKKSDKAKTKKEKAKKEPAEKKEGRRIILFRGKSKNKSNTNATGTETNDPAAIDVDPNNNDLKEDAANQTASEQNSETASTSSGSTLQGKETAV